MKKASSRFANSSILGLLLLAVISCGKTYPKGYNQEPTSPNKEQPSESEKLMMLEAGDPKEDVLKSYLEKKAPHPGASLMGRVFDTGPRQLPTEFKPDSVLLKTPITSCTEDALTSISYAFSYLHAFELIEAERQFRHAFFKDENCTMALWGAGFTQLIFDMGNLDRGLKFVKLADALTTHKKIQLTALEKALLKNLLQFYKSDRDSTEKIKFVKNWDSLSKKYPEEIELKAFNVLFIWNDNLFTDLKYKREDLNRWIDEILAQVPLHPVHHYKIHLWNDEDEKQALDSGLKIGLSFVNSAHMWHMGAHVYGPLGMPFESDEQFLRGAYLDQSYQKSILEFPYQLHNYSHNQNFWGNTLGALGEFRKSFALIRGLFKIPLHPMHNNPSLKTGAYYSAYNAALDNLLSLSKNYDLNKELLEFEGLVPAENYFIKPAQVKDKGLLLSLYYQFVWAHKSLADNNETLSLQRIASLLNANPFLKAKANLHNKVLAILDRWVAGEHRSELVDEWARVKWDGSPLVPSAVLAKYYRLAKSPEKALKVLNYVEDPKNVARSDVYDYLELAHAHASLGNIEKAKSLFEKVKVMGAYMDSHSEPFVLGLEVASLLGSPQTSDWRKAHHPRDLLLKVPVDFNGVEFKLPVAPDFELQSMNGKNLSLNEALNSSEKGVVLVFVLGGSCVGCSLQLRELNKKKEEMDLLGYKTVVITTDPAESVQEAYRLSPPSRRVQYELLSDESMSVFRQYRSFDGFENLPLHGTYVIQKDKRIPFLDRGTSPFKSFDFLVSEIKRLESIQ